VWHFLDIIDPRSLFASAADVDKACKLLDEVKLGVRAASTTDQQLWDALKLKQAVLHPATNQPIFPPFRMSAFIPMNVPILVGMLSATSTPAIAAWQIINQSYNSALNYANRSGAEISNEQIFQSYAIAVSTALGISFGIRGLAKRSSVTVQRALDKVPWVIPYSAVAGAGAANILASRMTEITHGVPVSLEDGTIVGVSKQAGLQGVVKTIVTRAVGLPLPALVLPPLIMAVLPVPPQARMVSEVVVVTMCLAGALPMAIALFPPRLALSVESLEPEFANVIDPNTKENVKILYANKGL